MGTKKESFHFKNSSGEDKSSGSEEILSFVEYVKKYRRRLTHSQTGLPFEPSSQEDLMKNRQSFNAGVKMKWAVSLFAPFCFCVFFVSFFWNPYKILSSCAIAGLIGFGTNWIAIRMLFWPREARPIFNHGLIPSQRDQIIEKITNDVLDRLINETLIQQKIEESGVLQKFTTSTGKKIQSLIKNPEFKKDTKTILSYYVQKWLNDSDFRKQVRQKLTGKIEELGGGTLSEWILLKMRPFWQKSFIGILDQQLEQLPSLLEEFMEHIEHILEEIPKFIEDHRHPIEVILTKMQMGLISEINIRSIVMEQLEKVTAEELEVGFKEFSDDKLSFITILGGILGLIGGFIILWPIESLICISIILFLLYLLDIILYPIIQKKNIPKNHFEN